MNKSPINAELVRAPPPLTDTECQAIDMAMHQDKLNDGYAKRQQAQALAWQLRTESKDYP